MSHALVWTELSSSDYTTESIKEIPYSDLGTNVAGTWNKKVYKLKWINTSVSDVKIWLDNEHADIYTSSAFPVIKTTDNLKILTDLGFDFRFTPLDTFTINKLPNANAATVLNLSSDTLSGIPKRVAQQYIDGVKIDFGSLVLVKSQSTASENGLYKVIAQYTGSGSTGIIFYNGDDLIVAGKIVSIGSSSFYAYSSYLSPFQSAALGATSVIWNDRTTTYRLKNVNCSTGGSNVTYNVDNTLTLASNALDGYSVSVNDRVLVKDQTTKNQNGIYYVSSLYASNANSIIDPRSSTSSLDSFWGTITNSILINKPVNITTLKGSSNAGKYYRYFSGTAQTGGIASTSVLAWTNATHFYTSYTADFYYEVTSNSGLGFSFDNVGNAGTLTSTPTAIIDYNNSQVSVALNNKILVKHFNNAYSGIYNVTRVGGGTTGVWTRATNFDQASEIAPTLVQTTNNINNYGGNYFYFNKSITYKSNFILNSDSVSVSETYFPYTYEPVTNVISSDLTNFTTVSGTKFANAGIALSQRVLVSGQATTASLNGIYHIVASSGSTNSLVFDTNYSITRGAIATSSGTGASYFLYAPGTSTGAGSTQVKWVDISSAPLIKVSAVTSVDKISSGTYITPDDFDVSVSTGSTILVNTTNALVNGIYDATLGSATKIKSDYASGLTNWMVDIYKNVLTPNTGGLYSVSPNLRSQIKGIYQGASIGVTWYGELFVPEISFPSYNGYANYFGSEGKGSALIQELNIDWYKQDFQKYNVKAVYHSSSISGFPISSGTAISSLAVTGVGNTLILDGDDVLVYIGSGNTSASSYNGIWRAKSTGASKTIYFIKHEDFNFTSRYYSGTNTKFVASPYERPALVLAGGYFNAGTAFTFDKVYMQGVLSYNLRSSLLGSTSYTANDDDQLNAGSETFVVDSQVRLSRNYGNLYNFPKLAPIQHILNGDVNTATENINGDMLIVQRGTRLFSNISNSTTKYYYELGDRVYFQQANEDEWYSTSQKYISGIYQIVNINTTTWTYYLRKVKYNSTYGHLDYAKRLKIHANNTVTDSIFSLAKYEGTGSTYTWSESNYPTSLIDVYVLEDGQKRSYSHAIDFDIEPNFGYISRLNSFGTAGELYVFLYSNTEVPSYESSPKQAFNRYYNVDQVLVNKSDITSSTAKTDNSYTIEKSYFQVVNKIGTASTTDIKYNRDRKTILNSYSNSNNYSDNIHHIVGSASTNQYFFTSRLSKDGYYTKSGLANTSIFYDNGLTDPGTGKSIGLFTGSLYIEKTTSSGTSSTNWFDSLSLSSSDNILIYNNTTTDGFDKTLSELLQSSYINDKNIEVVHKFSGKRDQKIYTFSESTYKTVSLDYSSAFGATLSPIRATYSNAAGVGTFCLYFDPDSTNRATAERSWINEDGRKAFSYDVVSSANITDFDNVGMATTDVVVPMSLFRSMTAIPGQFSTGDLVLLKDQTDETKNGIYIITPNNFYSLTRASDFSTNSDIKALGRVSFNNKIYELVVPDDNSYTIGTTPLFWNQIKTSTDVNISVVSTANYSGVALTSAIPDVIDGYTLSSNDKVLLLGQTSKANRYIGRFSQISSPTLTRVTSGGAGNTSYFSITNCFVTDTNKNLSYELYFNPSLTTLGTDPIEWFQRSYISDYSNCAFGSTTNYNINSTTGIGVSLGSRILLKSQSDNKENGIYILDTQASYFLGRHEDLDSSSELNVNKRVQVLGGNTASGIYGLIFDESVSNTIDSSNIYWAKVTDNNILEDCKVASVATVNLSSLPSAIDDIVLEKGDRILLKNQSSASENGIYTVSDAVNKSWVRAEDLDTSAKLVPQLTTKVQNGSVNADTTYRIKLGTPLAITNTQLTEYNIGTSSINWVSVDSNGLIEQSPETWTPILAGSDNYINIGNAKMGSDGIAESKRFAIAVKTPSTATLSTNGITENGKVRNIKFKIEYKTIED